mmetsp:Transcript_865/g.1322  ORF Transcript_865/g.1322 Transcript_865/m.1322 type:complete len:121 (+) Transcript_865:278-640(+)
MCHNNCIGLIASDYFVYVRYSYVLTPDEQATNLLRRAPTRWPDSKKSGTTAKQQQSQNNDNNVDDRSSRFYWGQEFNPRWDFGLKILDVKMFLYLIRCGRLGRDYLQCCLLRTGSSIRWE